MVNDKHILLYKVFNIHKFLFLALDFSVVFSKGDFCDNFKLQCLRELTSFVISELQSLLHVLGQNAKELV